MNNWKDVPHLFANGKFKVKYTSYLGEVKIGVFDGLHLELMDDSCTLIARKIEDMTDDELMTFHNEVYSPFEKMDKLDLLNAVKRSKDMESVLYLLSIGVYPFSQEHFETGEVIDAKTV